MDRRTSKMKVSLGKTGLRSQVSASYALMAVLPILGLWYLIWSYVDPEVLSQQNTVLILVAIVAISIFGFVILRGVVKALSDFRGHLRAVVEDRVLDAPASSDEPGGPTPESLEDVVYGLLKHNTKLSDMFSDLEEQTWNKTRELTRVNLELQRQAEKHKEVENQLRKSNMQLSDALMKLKDLQQCMIRHERLSALGQLASGIAHDINNALMPVMGFSELILEDASIRNDEVALIKMLNDILDGAKEASEVVSKLRNFYRRDATLNFVEVRAERLAEEVIELTRPRWEQEHQAKGRRIEFNMNITAGTSFKADQILIRDALVSVVMNAVDAMPDGGRINLSISKDDENALIEIEDNGAGMNDLAREHCLEPFFTTKGPEATGMGLAVAYGTVRRHSGSIEVDSSPGKGTTVRVTIPLENTDIEEPLPHGPGIAPSLQPLRILVIDDEKKARATLEEILKPGKHYVTLAATGTAGIAKAKEDDFDVVITDRAMPDLSGDEVAAAIRAAKPDLPIIMVTGFGELMLEQRETPEGVDRIISKPVDSVAFKWALAELTRKKA